MRCTIQVNRKEGRSNYGSEGASVEFSLDVPDGEITTNPAGLVDTIRRAQALADQCVEESLARTRDEQQAEPPDRAPVVVSRGNGIKEGPGERIPTRQPTRRAADPDADLPGDSRQLAARGRKVDQGAVPGYWKALLALGRDNGWSGRILDWDNEQVSAGIDLYHDMLDNPAPAPRNGAYSNGHARNGFSHR